MSRDPQKAYSAPALEKGLDIIELLSVQDTGLSQSQIARALNRSVSEIFRMLTVLQERGYVAQDPVSDRYMLTTFIFEIANRIPKIGRLTSIAGPMMQTMAKSINQSVHLAIASDDSILVVGQVNSPGNNQMSVRLGARIDLWQASSGRVILAMLPEAELEHYLQRVPLPRNTDADRLRAELAEIREARIEVRDSFVIKGVVNISVPVIDHSGFATAALTIPHIERYGDPIAFDDCKAALIATAAALSKSLGSATP